MNLKYPIGKFKCPEIITPNHVDYWISEIEELPVKILYQVSKFSELQLETSYREGGWTARQVVHHIADSHQNSYIRFKWALTEDKPVVKTYYEDRWADLFDTKIAPIHLSLNYIKALHAKWVYLLKGLSMDDLEKVFIHPDDNKVITLKENIGIYSWHGNHHLAHLKIIANKF